MFSTIKDIEDNSNSDFVRNDAHLSEKNAKYSTKSELTDKGEKKKSKQHLKKKLLLPWWTRIIGHIFCNLLILTAAVFIVFMGIQFGEDKVKRWLASLFISFLTSIILCQPIQVYKIN